MSTRQSCVFDKNVTQSRRSPTPRRDAADTLTQHHWTLAPVCEARSRCGVEVLKEMSKKVKGMVQLAGITYRIVRARAGTYHVVRIADDCEVGSFHTAPALEIEARAIAPALLRDIARLAIHMAKTSYVSMRAPMHQRAAEAAQVAVTPSSIPPPLAAT